MESAWDELLDLLERVATHPHLPLDAATQARASTLAAQSMGDLVVDRELNPDDVGRWIVGLAAGYRFLADSNQDLAPDDLLGPLRQITTRWLHPARPR